MSLSSKKWRADVSVHVPTSDDLGYCLTPAVKKDGRPAILDYLPSQGAPIDDSATIAATSQAMLHVCIKHGWKVDGTPFRSYNKDLYLVSFLLSHGAIADDVLTFRYATLHAVLEVVNFFLSHAATLPLGNSALHAAVKGDAPDHNAVMACLLDHGADINELGDGFLGDSEGGRSGQRGTLLHETAK